MTRINRLAKLEHYSNVSGFWSMSDVFVSHAREDRAACERLAEALTCVGLTVTWDKSFDQHSHFADQMDQAVQSASTTIVLWSESAIRSDWVKSEARRAFHLAPKNESSASNRYAGLIVDETAPQDLPGPFNGLDTPVWKAWFHSDAPSFDDPGLIGLLAVLEKLTGRRQLAATARALAIRDAETARLRALVKAQDDTLSKAKEANTQLESRLMASDAELADRSREAADLAAKVAELDGKCLALESARDASNDRARILDNQLRAAVEESGSFQALLDQANEALRHSREGHQAIERELEDARNGLAAALRQQKTLQGQIEADDQTIQQIMTQRAELIQTRDKLEKDRARLTQNVVDAESRLADSESRRETYVVSLVERKREIDALSDKLAVASADASLASRNAEQARDVLKTWGHVPWRRMAAGGVAAGALVTAVAFYVWRIVETPIEPTGQVAAAPSSGPTPSMPIPAAGPPQTLQLQQKSEAKVAPDTLNAIAADNSEEQRPTISPDDGSGEIPIPDETGAPSVNDQVEFNPDGLPPVDPDSRPPPQDLPPMQQMPKLLLKPTVPPAAEVP